MNQLPVMTLLLGVFIAAMPARGADEVVINEIMYHPFHTAVEAEDTGKEWIELHNRGTNTVNMNGWRLTRGIEFTFTSGIIPPGGFLVAAANRTSFLASNPGITNVVGGWIGRLANSDDDISLLNPMGEVIDELEYADSGEWAIRARQSVDAYGLRGWDWLATHDGGGMTLELINSSMPNEFGQNWNASVGANGTPGRTNSVVATNTAPLIHDVSYFPLVPRSVDSVTITAQLEDETPGTVSVSLFFRDATSASPPSFGVTLMYDDGAHGDGRAGDGIYAATLPPQQNGTVMEFYITANDGGGRVRTWPAPARNAPDLGGGALPPESGANPVYQVDDSEYTGTQPIYRMIMRESERAFLASIAGSLRNSDAMANGTFISIDPNGTEVHHRVSFRRRGAGSRGAAIPNYRVAFASDRRWKGVTAVNLNSQYTHAQVGGAALAAASGLNVEYQKPVQVRVNAVNQASLGSPQFGSFAQQEAPNGDFASRHYPNDPNGNIYRASDGSHRVNLSYLGTDPNSYSSVGYSKTSNSAEHDWSDLINLTDVLNNTPPATYAEAVRQRVNVEQWMRYFAIFTLLDSRETSLATGNGDDYGMYRGLIDSRFQLLGHDFDTILNQGDTGGNINDSIFRMNNVAAIGRFMREQEFAPIYYRTLTNLIYSSFSPEQLGATLDQQLGSWVPAGIIANMKTFAAARNGGVLAQIPLNLSISHSLPLSGGYPVTVSPNITIFGLANAVATRTVLVNGAASTWSAWNARWTNTVSLLPGVNRLIVQTLDENGVEFERGQIDVWYNSGTMTDVAGEISDVVNWTTANSPYRITGNLVVPDETTLNIEAGVTIYVAPGATITVQDTGRINAMGTEYRRIRIGRQPNTGANWSGLVFSTSLASNRLSYVDFDSCSGTTINGQTAQVHVNQSRVWFDHCTWPSTPLVQYISFDGSSFIVEGCTFPSFPGPNGVEMIHGINGIPGGGYGIFRDNYFGRTWGYNDVIDFTGGQRPGPILQIIGNVFEGASDDHLDLDSADAWIEGNIFLHAHRDPTRTDDARDTASAISGGVDFAGQYPEWTIINNIFYDVDHVVLNKGGGRYAFVNNTVVHVNKEWGAGLSADIAAFIWTDVGVPLPDPAIGSGAYVANNIIWDAPLLAASYNPVNHTMIFENNLLPMPWAGPGTNNVVADPRLNLSLIANKTNVTWRTLRQALLPLAGSPAVGSGYGAKYDRGGLNAQGLLVFGEPRGTTAVNTATITVAPGGAFDWGTNAYSWGFTTYKWKLDNGPWSAELSTAAQPTINLNNLANGPHTVFVAGQNDAGYYQDNPFVYATNGSFPSMVTTSRTWVVDAALSRIVINEVLARNVAALPVGSGFPDAIELYNAGKAALDIGGMSLSDELTSRKFVFPGGTMIPAGGYLVVYAGNGEAPGRIFTGFSLNDTGEGLYLRNSLAAGGGLLDSVVFGLQIPDLSIGRLPDGTWGLTQPTFGSANIVQRIGRKETLKINEWLAAAGSVFESDFVEIFNPDTLPVAIGGLALSDSPVGAPRMSVIPPLSFIAANGWQSFVADGEITAGANHVNFRLSADGGWIGLADLDGTFIDLVVYATQVPDLSVGRSPDGTASFVSFNQATPGGGNPGQTVIVTPITTTILPFNHTWRMEASALDLGTTWRSPSYNDSSWFSGNALFFNDDSGSPSTPVPIRSTIPFTSPKQITVYFRTTFNYSGPTNGVTFLLSQVIDDGCVVYLNGAEVHRYNFAPGATVTYSTRPSLVSGTAQLLSGFPVSLPTLVQGTNHLAVEVHQQSSTSSDMAMALQVERQQYITNYLGIPVVLNEVFVSNQSRTNSSGKVVDWVELYNPSSETVDISDLSLSDDPARPRRWAFPQGAVIAPGGYYVVEFDDSQPYSPFNAGFELSSESGAVYLFHRPVSGGGLVDSVVYGIQVADLALGRAAPGPNSSWTLCEPTRAAANATVTLGDSTLLKVNEWMPNADSGEDDWFEIYNPGSYPVALGGLRLTDDLSNRTKHTIRGLSFIGSGPNSWVEFIADNNIAAGADHVSFALSATAESIGLYSASPVPALIDSITYNGSQSGVSQGRLPDGASTITSFTNSVSPGAANWLPLNSVVINEVLTRPSPNVEQAIEIYNPTDVDVAIGGWYLSNARRDLRRFEIPAGTIIPAGGFAVFYANQFNPGNDVPPSFAFNWSSDDEIYLSAADANGNLTGYRAVENFGASAAARSFGRHQKSTGTDFVAMAPHTFGADTATTPAQFRTGTGAANVYPVIGPVVINEIQYHPPDVGTNDNVLEEFIELANISASPVNLFSPSYPTNKWRLRNGVDFDFPDDVTIEPGGFVVVIGFDPATNAAITASFRSRYNIDGSVTLLGPWSGKLDNSGEPVELQRPDHPLYSPDPEAGRVPYILVDRVNYSDSAPWASMADGNAIGAGLSLQRRISSRYGNDATNWVAAAPTPGSFNAASPAAPPLITSAPGNTNATAGNNVVFAVVATGAGPLTYQWRLDDEPIAGATNSSLTLLNVQPNRAGRYSVIVANQWGSALGGPARLSVQAPPLIVQQPQSRTVVAGEDTTFVVTASGGMLGYQWRFNGTNLPGATAPIFTLSAVSLGASGPYSVVVSNALGTVTSVVANLTVLMPPTITMQPQSQGVIIGNNAGFIVSATGTAPLSYRWHFNGTPIAGATATAPSLTIASAQPTNEGIYTVVISNIAGVTTSTVAALTVIVPPTVNVLASDSSASEPGGNTGLFTFARTGSTASNLVVHYSISGTAVGGADYGTLSGSVVINAGASSAGALITPVDDSLLEGDETVIVTITSHVAYLVGVPDSATVIIRDNDNEPPVIAISSPVSGQLFVNTPTNITITTTASDPDGSIAKVEFFANGTNKLGERVAAPFSFVWTNAPAGSYVLTARATDNLGSTSDSTAVNVVLNAMPTVGVVSPVHGATFTAPATIAINAFASDTDGSVTQVTFHANALLVGRDTASPFSVTLTNAAPGVYALRAVAMDNRGAASTSAVVTVVVNQPGIFDDFEPGVDLAQWSAFGSPLGSAIRATNYGGSVSGTHSLWFGGDFDRWAATRSIDASLGGSISFQLRFSNESSEPWETVDVPGEGVLLEYSVDDGTNWLPIATFDTPGANYTQGWALQYFPLPSGAQTTNTMFRWRQMSHSGSCCDHWAIDDVQVLVGPTPPTISSHPSDQSTIIGGAATFTVSVFGSAPFGYQWRFNGTDIPGATGANLGLSNVSTNSAGIYSVVVTNAYGIAVSSNATLTVREAGSEYFRVSALRTTGSALVEHASATGDDHGGIAVSPTQVFVTGDSTTARFSAVNLSSAVGIGFIYDGLLSDLRTETVYTLATDATSPIFAGYGLLATHLLELNGGTGQPNGNVIRLTRPIPFNSSYGDYGFFAGYGRAVVHNGERVYDISLPSGVVTDMGLMNVPQHTHSETWGYWGIAELTTNGLSLVFVRDSQSIVRTRVPDGNVTVLGTFTGLSDMASFSVSVPRNRWYFHHEGGSQFGGSDESVGYADAQFELSPGANQPPRIVLAPQEAQAAEGSSAYFSVSAVGSPTMAYQWRFNNAEIFGAVGPTFGVLEVRPENVGTYSVVISNQFGAVTSSPVSLIIGYPPVITNQPQSQAVIAGADVTFSVGHSGTGPFTYHWYAEGSEFLVTTSNSITFESVSYYYNATFSVEVRNAVGSAMSDNATLVVVSPPFLTQPFADKQVLRGMNTSIGAALDGSQPYYVRWQKNGLDLASTNETLLFPDVQPSSAGLYTLIASNAYGSLVSTVRLDVLEVDADSFAVRSLGTSDVIMADAYPAVGYFYQNGIAADSQSVFLNGYGNSGEGFAAAFSTADLSGGTPVGTRNGLVSDLKTRVVYSMATGTNLIAYEGLVTTLVRLDAAGQPTTNIITLSSNIFIGSGAGIFAGYGRVVLLDGENSVWEIALPSGQVKNLGVVPYFPYEYAYGFAYRGWGVAERVGTNTWLVHVRDRSTIERVRVPDGLSEVVATFDDLGSAAANFTVSVLRNRWYYNFAYNSQFGGFSANHLVSLAASFIYSPPNTAPVLLDHPVSRYAPAGSTVVLSALADGAPPLRYQWLFGGNELPWGTNASLSIINLRGTNAGAYHVIISNHLGAVTSAVANVSVDYGASTSNTVPILSMTNTIWRFNQTAAFSGTAWTGSNFNDSAWPSGRALLAVENNTAITPLRGTTLTLGRVTYYFRVYFNMTSNFPPGTMLRATTMIDDGAVISINGREVQRARMNSSYSYNTFANNQAPNSGDAQQEFFYWPATNLLRGSNVIAVEVHQVNSGSSDIVWGMALDAQVPVANRPPLITSHPISATASNGGNASFTVAATGTTPLYFQWMHQGTNIPGAVTPVLNLANVQARHAGVYAAVVTNRFDAAVSSNAMLVVLVPPLRFGEGSATFTAPGQFTLRFMSDAGSVVAVERSTNLVNWSEVGTVTNTTGTVQFTDPTAGGSAHNFYRLKLK